MKVGASTANLYPKLTENALESLLVAEIELIEVFLNSRQEADLEYAKKLKSMVDSFGAEIISVHPYTSNNEPFWLFSNYKRRFYEMKQEFERIFACAQALGANFVVLHGDGYNSSLDVEKSIKRFYEIYKLGQDYEITLLQENVLKFRSQSVSYIKAMRQILGDDAKFAFDLKQCIRSGLHPSEVINAMGTGLKHAHISDYDYKSSCLLPTTGIADYKDILKTMENVGFNGNWIVELYRHNFNGIKDLTNSIDSLKKIVNKE